MHTRAQLDSTTGNVNTVVAVKISLRTVALVEKIDNLHIQLTPLVLQVAPTLLVTRQIGTYTLAQLLATTEQSMHRSTDTAVTFARLRGNAVIPRPPEKPPDTTSIAAATDKPTRPCTLILAVEQLKKPRTHSHLRHPTHHRRKVQG